MITYSRVCNNLCDDSEPLPCFSGKLPVLLLYGEVYRGRVNGQRHSYVGSTDAYVDAKIGAVARTWLGVKNMAEFATPINGVRYSHGRVATETEKSAYAMFTIMAYETPLQDNKRLRIAKAAVYRNDSGERARLAKWIKLAAIKSWAQESLQELLVNNDLLPALGPTNIPELVLCRNTGVKVFNFSEEKEATDRKTYKLTHGRPDNVHRILSESNDGVTCFLTTDHRWVYNVCNGNPETEKAVDVWPVAVFSGSTGTARGVITQAYSDQQWRDGQLDFSNHIRHQNIQKINQHDYTLQDPDFWVSRAADGEFYRFRIADMTEAHIYSTIEWLVLNAGLLESRRGARRNFPGSGGAVEWLIAQPTVRSMLSTICIRSFRLSEKIVTTLRRVAPSDPLITPIRRLAAWESIEGTEDRTLGFAKNYVDQHLVLTEHLKNFGQKPRSLEL